jgi:hypothetical protein
MGGIPGTATGLLAPVQGTQQPPKPVWAGVLLGAKLRWPGLTGRRSSTGASGGSGSRREER